MAGSKEYCSLKPVMVRSTRPMPHAKIDVISGWLQLCNREFQRFGPGDPPSWLPMYVLFGKNQSQCPNFQLLALWSYSWCIFSNLWWRVSPLFSGFLIESHLLNAMTGLEKYFRLPFLPPVTASSMHSAWFASQRLLPALACVKVSSVKVAEVKTFSQPRSHDLNAETEFPSSRVHLICTEWMWDASHNHRMARVYWEADSSWLMCGRKI